MNAKRIVLTILLIVPVVVAAQTDTDATNIVTVGRINGEVENWDAAGRSFEERHGSNVITVRVDEEANRYVLIDQSTLRMSPAKISELNGFLETAKEHMKTASEGIEVTYGPENKTRREPINVKLTKPLGSVDVDDYTLEVVFSINGGYYTAKVLLNLYFEDNLKISLNIEPENINRFLRLTGEIADAKYDRIQQELSLFDS